MNKFKKIMLGALSVLTLGLFVVTGSKVFAEGQYGKYTVTNTETVSTAVWDFSNADDMPSANVTVKGLTDNTLYGIGGDASKGITLKASEKNISNNKTGVLYVPVPSADAAGTITLLGSSSNSARTLTLAVVTQDEGSTLTNKVYTYSSSAVNITFDSSYITTSGSTYWLKFDPNGQEVKLKKITVALTSSTQYAATAATHVVTIKDGDTTIKTFDVDDGDSFDKPISIWGYSSVSLYTNAGLTDAYTDAAITADTTLWVSKTVDTTDYGYNLTTSMINKLSGVYNTSTEDIEITDYYTKKVSAVATTSYLQLKNTEAQSLVINVPSGGLNITVSCSTGGSSDRNIYLYKTTFGENEVTAFTTVLPNADYTARNVSTTLEEGTYYLAGSDNIRVYSITMTEITLADNVEATTAAYQNSDKSALKIIGTISGIEDLADIKSIELVLLKNDVETKNPIFLTTCFTSVKDIYTASEGTYYTIFRITGITAAAMPDGTVIKHQIIVTFTDDSSVTSEVQSSTWTN